MNNIKLLEKKIKAKSLIVNSLCKVADSAVLAYAKAYEKWNDAELELTELISELDDARSDAADKLLNQEEVDLGNIPSVAQRELMATQLFSYGVTFQRSKAVNGEVILTSTRTFTTEDEAIHHGERFSEKHGHAGFTVVPSNNKANAWVNWKTGKTNPAI
jgi:hypothetical protein